MSEEIAIEGLHTWYRKSVKGPYSSGKHLVG